MKATLRKIQKQKSKFGGDFYYLFFKGEDGNTYHSCIYPRFGNFQRWQPFLDRPGVMLDGLTLKGKLIDADSFPREIKCQTEF